MCEEWCERWYENRDDLLVIKLLPHPQNRFWDPEVLSRNPLPASTRGSGVLVEGPGPVWMYAHVGAWAAAQGKRLEVQTVHPGGSGGIEQCRWQMRLAQENRAFLNVHMPRSAPLSPTAVEESIKKLSRELEQVRPRILVIGGRASVKVYAELAHASVKIGVERIACWSARDGLILVFPVNGSGERLELPSWLTQMVKPESSKIWGIIGDPHRGKSVFSEALLVCLEEIGYSVWKLDCDAASPTPPWFMNKPGDPSLQKLREELKLPWTPPMKLTVAAHLRQGRKLFEILIADLPGGNHKADPPVRISPDDVPIFEQIDKFILLAGTKFHEDDWHNELNGWKEELKEYNLDNRIAAVLVSVNPENPPHFHIASKKPILHGRIEGLDRSHRIQDIAKVIQPHIKSFCDALS